MPLEQTLLVDIVAAIASSAAVAPFISIIDQAIFSNASGKEKLGDSLVSSTKRLVKNPLAFVKSPQFLWIWFVYSGTYIVANSSETLAISYGQDPKLPKFLASSAANISLSMAKDGYFTRAFGKGTPGKVGIVSYSCYATRDSATVFASFILPKYFAERLEQQGFKHKTSMTIAQLLSPCLIQFASTPIHLYGNDVYNRPHALMNERASFIRREYFRTVSARIGRIFPAFGIGGVANSYIRTTYSK